MSKELERLEQLWYERNPQHEINSDTGEDMFFKTVLCVFESYHKERVKEETAFAKIRNALSPIKSMVFMVKDRDFPLFRKSDIMNEAVEMLIPECEKSIEYLSSLDNPQNKEQ